MGLKGKYFCRRIEKMVFWGGAKKMIRKCALASFDNNSANIGKPLIEVSTNPTKASTHFVLHLYFLYFLTLSGIGLSISGTLISRIIIFCQILLDNSCANISTSFTIFKTSLS